MLALDGMTAPEIAAKLDRSRRFVQQWVYRYRDGGPTSPSGLAAALPPNSGVTTKPLFISASRLTLTEVMASARFVAKTFNVFSKRSSGHRIPCDGVYDLLHRLGYSCLKPQPRHRKNDVDRMHELISMCMIAEPHPLSTIVLPLVHHFTTQNGGKQRNSVDQSSSSIFPHGGE